MTKLFSMKSLAFAGAAAFALTLAAAPQAEAAETADAKIKFGYCDGMDEYGGMDEYVEEIPGYTSTNLVVSASAVTITPEGKVEYYYSAAKTGKEPKKWVSALAQVDDITYTDKSGKVVGFPKEGKEKNKPNNVYFTVPSKNLVKGKAVDLYFAVDSMGTGKSDKLVYNKAPKKVKAVVTYTATGPAVSIKDVKDKGTLYVNTIYGGFGIDSIYLNDDQQKIYEKMIEEAKLEEAPSRLGSQDLTADLAAGETVTFTYEVTNKDGKAEEKAYPSDINKWLSEMLYSNYCEQLQGIADIGGGKVEVTYSPVDDGKSYTPSKVVKTKIAGPKAAPKLSLKMAKKGYVLKLKDTIKYRTLSEEGSTLVDWTVGNKSGIAMDAAFGKDSVAAYKFGDVDESILSNTVKFQYKTFDKNGKKSDSKVGTSIIYASAATPTAVNAKVERKMEKKKKEEVTGASITFSVEGLKVTQSTGSSIKTPTLEYRKTGDKKWTQWKSGKNLAIKAAKINEVKYVYVRVKGTDASTKKGKEAFFEAPGHIMAIQIDPNFPEQSTYSITHGSIFVDKSEATVANLTKTGDEKKEEAAKK